MHTTHQDRVLVHEHETGPHRLGVSSGLAGVQIKAARCLQCQAKSCQLKIMYIFPTGS